MKSSLTFPEMPDIYLYYSQTEMFKYLQSRVEKTRSNLVAARGPACLLTSHPILELFLHLLFLQHLFSG